MNTKITTRKMDTTAIIQTLKNSKPLLVLTSTLFLLVQLAIRNPSEVVVHIPRTHRITSGSSSPGIKQSQPDESFHTSSGNELLIQSVQDKNAHEIHADQALKRVDSSPPKHTYDVLGSDNLARSHAGDNKHGRPSYKKEIPKPEQMYLKTIHNLTYPSLKKMKVEIDETDISNRYKQRQDLEQHPQHSQPYTNKTVSNENLTKQQDIHTDKKKASKRYMDCIPRVPGSDTSVTTPRERMWRWQNGVMVDPLELKLGNRQQEKRLDRSTDQYLIYRCDDGVMTGCCGWSDRVRGILTAYVIANITGRVFKIEMLDQGCDMTEFLIPNKVNWSLPKSFHPRLDPNAPGVQVIDVVNNHTFGHTISTTNFSNFVDASKRFVYFKANLNCLHGIRNSKYHQENVKWMARTGFHRIHAVLFRHLFKFSNHLKQRMVDFLRPLQDESGHDSGKLICAHVRVGDPLAFFKNFHHHVEFPVLDNLWSFISRKITEAKTLENPEIGSKDSLKIKIFITSDSSTVVTLASQQGFHSDLLTVPGQVVHIDKNDDMAADVRCSGFGKLLLEQQILASCDVLLMGGKTGVSNQASYLRASKQELYTLTSNYTIAKETVYC